MGQLEKWFQENQRAFPWREDTNPYKVWISEVMLQQTRASVVIAYFNSWMEQFPDVKALYNAKLEDLIKAWEGLGYYSRVRNIHRAAKRIVEQFGGELPKTKEELLQIEGLGPYTVGAILSFAFHKRAIAIDGNVLRVISRLFCIEENICHLQAKRKIEEQTLHILDASEPWVSMEALIELGATVCLPKPRCEMCPMQNRCIARERQKEELLPIKNAKPSIERLLRKVYVIQYEDFFLLQKGTQGKVMADLHEFPYTAYTEEPLFYPGKCSFFKKIMKQSHSFTKYKVDLFPVWLKADSLEPVEGYEWVHQSKLAGLPFSSGHRKILEVILSAI